MPTHSGEEEDNHQKIGSRRIAIYNCNCNVKKEIKSPHWGGKLFFFLKTYQLSDYEIGT
jgi:hypothetical protein